MVLFNYAIREITAKLVYYGPGLGGKTTNLQQVHARLDPRSRGKLLSLATDADRTLFFDFLPIDLGSIGGYHVRFQLYTVPGQVHYNATRKLVLKGVDAVVFVADSQVEMMERNRESFENLAENLAENGYDVARIPLVIQLNKQDLPNIASRDEMIESLGFGKYTIFEATAAEGIGVFETLKEIIKLTVDELKIKFQAEGETMEKGMKDVAAASFGRPEEKPPETLDQPGTAAAEEPAAPAAAAGPPEPPEIEEFDLGGGEEPGPFDAAEAPAEVEDFPSFGEDAETSGETATPGPGEGGGQEPEETAAHSMFAGSDEAWGAEAGGHPASEPMLAAEPADFADAPEAVDEIDEVVLEEEVPPSEAAPAAEAGTLLAGEEIEEVDLEVIGESPAPAISPPGFDTGTEAAPAGEAAGEEVAGEGETPEEAAGAETAGVEEESAKEPSAVTYPADVLDEFREEMRKLREENRRLNELVSRVVRCVDLQLEALTEARRGLKGADRENGAGETDTGFDESGGDG